MRHTTERIEEKEMNLDGNSEEIKDKKISNRKLYN